MQHLGGLKDLIELLNDGAKFYAEAMQKVHEPAFRDLFAHMADTKRAIAADLASQLVASGEAPPHGGTLWGTLRQTYADLRSRLDDQPETVYVAQLEQTEDRILEAFREELDRTMDSALRMVIERHYPEVKRMHAEMRELKHQLAG